MILVPVFLGLIGLAFGSFVGALVWRLHEGKDFVSDRSECEHCHHKLGPLDLIPLVSWLALKGKCRYCGAKIGVSAPLLEIIMATLFVGSYFVWPLPFETWQAWTSFGLWLVYLVGLMALLVYDLKWMILPNVIVFPLMGVAVVESAIRFSIQPGVTPLDWANSAIFGIITLAGLYWVLYTFSKGKWVGYGDVKLGLFMGIALGFQRSLLALFLANIIGFLVVLPGVLTGKLKRTSRIPFGPFLIAAFVTAFLFGDKLINWYIGFILGN
ncbi:MAG TPA: prepilin peptidase [Candidatus Saccharimonadales bacterium]|nr:prepilin peptidase [Candidatus Saccharimonadales bacterium]